MKNPDNTIRKAVLKTVKDSIGIPCFDSIVPISISPKPTEYALLTNQTRVRYTVSKNCYEWICEYDIQLFVISKLGTIKRDKINDWEGVLVSAVENMTLGDGFFNKNTDFEGSFNQDYDTENNSFNKKILSFSTWTNFLD